MIFNMISKYIIYVNLPSQLTDIFFFEIETESMKIYGTSLLSIVINCRDYLNILGYL